MDTDRGRKKTRPTWRWSNPATSKTPRGAGLLDQECPERRQLNQTMPGGPPPHPRMCTMCGRATVRSADDGLAWCGGSLAFDPPAGHCRVCAHPLDPFHAAVGTHPSCDPHPAG